MSNPTDKRRTAMQPLTAKERQNAWYDHMKGVVAQNPANWGSTVLIANHGRTYKFTINERGAVVSGADLRDAHLRGADLRGAVTSR